MSVPLRELVTARDHMLPLRARAISLSLTTIRLPLRTFYDLVHLVAGISVHVQDAGETVAGK